MSKPAASSKIAKSAKIVKAAKPIIPKPIYHEFMTPEITVRARITIDPDPATGIFPLDSWMLEFEIKQPRSSMTFVAHEPCLISRSQWRAAERGEDGVTLYQGSGDGAIDIIGDEFIFTTDMRGGGGDVSLSCAIPKEIACPVLTAVLNDADQLGLEFYRESENVRTDDDSEDDAEAEADAADVTIAAEADAAEADAAADEVDVVIDGDEEPALDAEPAEIEVDIVTDSVPEVDVGGADTDVVVHAVKDLTVTKKATTNAGR